MARSATFMSMPPQDRNGYSSQEDSDQDDEALEDASSSNQQEEESGADHSGSGQPSTTDSDSDTEQEDWKNVPFDFLLTDELINKVERGMEFKLPEKLPSPAHPPPSKEQASGQWRFVEYIPSWTHPDRGDEFILTEEGGVQEKAFDKELPRRLRPALLPIDEVKNPTPYARRWGMHPDRTDGRSRLSPTNASSRRVGFSRPLSVPGSQPKLFLTGTDLCEVEGGAATHTMSVDDYLKALETSSGDLHMWAPFRELYSLIQQDQDYQRVLFRDLTTDEMVSHGLHTTENLGQVQYDLSGPLHPLLDRFRWVSTVDRGNKEDEPRYLYNLFGRRGEYCGDDDFVWMAMQPALQLVSRVLNTNHPFWLAALNMFHRKPVDDSLKALGRSGAKVMSLLQHVEPQALPPLAATLQSSGFDPLKAAAGFLRDHLELSLTSAYRKVSGERGHSWGTTEVVDIPGAMQQTVRIDICAEMIWPLLVPFFTQTEKASVSLMVASTLLHELAHAAHMAVRCLTVAAAAHQVDIPQLAGLDQDIAEALEDFGEEIGAHVDREPYWEDEPRSELGYAFEKQLFRGLLFALQEDGFEKVEFLAFSLGLDTWPTARPDPHREHTRILTYPPLPVDALVTPLPVKSWKKLYNQNFWECDMQKYGHRALNLVPETPVPVQLNRSYQRLRDFQRAFGKGEGQWMYTALIKLDLAGKSTLHLYLRELVKERLEHVWVRKRWHHESKVWPYRQEKLLGLMKASNAVVDNVAEEFVAINRPHGEKVNYVNEYNQQVAAAQLDGRPGHWQRISLETLDASLFQKLQDLVNESVIRFWDLHYHFLAELQHTQVLVTDYVQQKPESRQVLYERYACYLHQNIQDSFEPILESSVGSLADLSNMLLQMGVSTPEAVADIRRIGTALQIDLNNFVETRTYLAGDSIDRIEEVWRGRLATVASGRYVRHSKLLEQMALRETLRCEEPIRRVVERFGVMLDKHVNMPGSLSKAQEQQRRAKLEDYLKASREQSEAAVSMAGFRGITQATPGPLDTNAAPRVPAVSAMAWRQEATPRHLVSRNMYTVFGVPTPPRSATPSETPPLGMISVEDPTTGFTQYATAESPFSSLQGSPILGPASWPSFGPASTATPASDRLTPLQQRKQAAPTSTPRVQFGGSASAPVWQPFGTAYSVPSTTSEGLQLIDIQTPYIEHMFGAYAYTQDQATEGGTVTAAGQTQNQAQAHKGDGGAFPSDIGH